MMMMMMNMPRLLFVCLVYEVYSPLLPSLAAG